MCHVSWVFCDEMENKANAAVELRSRLYSKDGQLEKQYLANATKHEVAWKFSETITSGITFSAVFYHTLPPGRCDTN